MLLDDFVDLMYQVYLDAFCQLRSVLPYYPHFVIVPAAKLYIVRTPVRLLIFANFMSKSDWAYPAMHAITADYFLGVGEPNGKYNPCAIPYALLYSFSAVQTSTYQLPGLSP